MKYQLFIILDYPNSASISLEQYRLYQTTQVWIPCYHRLWELVVVALTELALELHVVSETSGTGSGGKEPQQWYLQVVRIPFSRD